MWNPTSEQFKETASRLLRYFEGLASKEGGGWHRNAFIAREWSRLLDAQAATLEDLQAFARLLSSSDIRGGSGWEEFTVWASKWLEIQSKG
jgi:hypothetical protein